MYWREIRISTTEQASDAVSEMLTTLGAAGVLIEDPNEIRRQIEAPGSLDYADEEFMNSLGTDVVIKAYFSSEEFGEGLEALVIEKLAFVSQFLDIGKGYESYSSVDDQDWATAWRKHYKPFRIGEHIIIKPSWENYEALSGDMIIELDPGMAFGTGTHETTRLCTMMLEKYLNKGDTVLDVGCGSGILSIAAAMLGAEAVMAADIDETAVKVTAENSAFNAVSEKITVLKGILTDLPEYEYDVVVANIIADVIISISQDVVRYLKAGGLFITSGIIKERKEEVAEACQKAGFIQIESLEQGEWAALVFKCPDFIQTKNQ